jgi:general secretion pathway protein E
MRLDERRKPQDGRFSATFDDRKIDFRVSVLPTNHGEKVVMRILDTTKGVRSLTESGISPKNLEIIKRIVKEPYGIILISGPTGSGKSTTLYACVLEIDRRRRHVLTIEDPIEYEMRYATQGQVNSGKEGLEFSDFIRSAMRHDPDYIIIGEMRDGATVETSLKAAESGHTVISTIHADTAIQTLERLRSFMPIERERSSTYTLSQQIRAILNQRLIRTLCHSCAHKNAAKEVLSEDDIDRLDLDPDDRVRTINPNGCDLCNRSGILGRTLLLEALLINTPLSKRDPIFHALMSNANEIIHQEGVKHYSRLDNLKGLVREGLIDPKKALLQLDE